MKASHTGFNPEYQEDAPSIEEVAELKGYAVIEFGATWCGHCKAAAPAIEPVLSKAGLPHIKVFDGKGKRLGRSFKVKLWPTLILLESGKEVARIVRPVETEEVIALLANIKA
ncbi:MULTISPECIES: thioredoxin family protein [unclassified Agarivorans]|uniref:thioredoxin family protein n=1 Tax=unclassified Agarivorans TaxID=2636026 RepID=UPI0026E1A4E6|nr:MULTISPECIES: thioredoxin family protein [unclassified Agarivorans]MDO6685008.1 thioredoxin family protein [Agarivorans sp. 3_MG-2023]MDO6717434.1 thioredoxin family protein [Agarivorans sp. 2_MG-2023]